MDHAVKIDQESRQSEVMRNRRNNSSELIDTTVNEISDIDINYVASRQGESRFNSTMKPGYQREGKDFSPRNRQNDSFQNNRSWNSPRNDNQSIVTISIEEIQRILKEDVNTIYDTLVASDYIEEIAKA